ncbi:MAG: hypothetical protein A2007_01815 [Verrucomicrobia bacterium GWC2_42_7]|nr:MAG: hypothetical protein A2007_01815 [Verrucomicrobia bacterium GWC2_42_7]
MLKGTDELGRWASFIGTGNADSDLLGENPEDILRALTQEQYQGYKEAFNATLERIRYKGEIQAPAYINGLYEKELSPFFTQIDQIFHPSDAEKCKILMTLSGIAKPLGRGAPEQLFRPTSSFGSRHEGESYRGFAKAFERYISLPNHRSEAEVASIMRSILSGGSLQDEDLYFLPNLITAWFISEVSRNSLTLMTNLMLLDMIEHGDSLDSGYGSNWYCWRNALVHPLKDLNSPQNIKIPNLYGKRIYLDEFGGCHPMAHNGSVSQTKQKLGIPLTVVRQKEAHLLIHWLALKINNLPQEKKDQYRIENAIAREHSSSFPQQIGKSLKDLVAERTQKEKRRDKDLKNIRVNRKERPEVDVSGQEKEVAKLVQEIEVLNKEIMNKNPIKTEIIDALLRRRMSTLRLM